jgi:hypothetical protein
MVVPGRMTSWVHPSRYLMSPGARLTVLGASDVSKVPST